MSSRHLGRLWWSGCAHTCTQVSEGRVGCGTGRRPPDCCRRCRKKQQGCPGRVFPLLWHNGGTHLGPGLPPTMGNSRTCDQTKGGDELGALCVLLRPGRHRTALAPTDHFPLPAAGLRKRIPLVPALLPDRLRGRWARRWACPPQRTKGCHPPCLGLGGRLCTAGPASPQKEAAACVIGGCVRRRRCGLNGSIAPLSISSLRLWFGTKVGGLLWTVLRAGQKA